MFRLPKRNKRKIYALVHVVIHTSPTGGTSNNRGYLIDGGPEAWICLTWTKKKKKKNSWTNSTKHIFAWERKAHRLKFANRTMGNSAWPVWKRPLTISLCFFSLVPKGSSLPLCLCLISEKTVLFLYQLLWSNRFVIFSIWTSFPLPCLLVLLIRSICEIMRFKTSNNIFFFVFALKNSIMC